MQGTKYPNLRSILAESYRGLPDTAIERVLAQQGLEAGAIEDFWGDLGNVVASALPIVGSAVGSIVAPGIGTAIGGGLGSLAGGALHSAIGSGQPAPAPTPVAPVPAAPVPSAMPYPYPPYPYPQPASFPGAPLPLMGPIFSSATPAAPAAQGSSQQLAALLLQLLMRPEMLQSILAMIMGGAGATTVPVGTTGVPVTALTNLLSNVAGQVSEAYNNERAPSAVYAEATHYTSRNPFAARVDLASQEARSAALLNLLRESDGGTARLRRKQRLANLAQALRMVHPAAQGV